MNERHPHGCMCLECYNRGASLGDSQRKAKLSDTVGHAQACDKESITVWLELQEWFK